MPRWFTRRSRDLLTVSALAAAFAAPARLTADLIYSPSRQFTAQSASVSLAGQAAVHADQIRDNFYSFLGLRINPGRPVQIELFESELGDSLEDYFYTPAVDTSTRPFTWVVTGRKERSPGSMSWSEAVCDALAGDLANRDLPAGELPVRWPAWFFWGATALSQPSSRGELETLWREKYQRRTYRSLRQIWGTPDDLQPDERERIQMLSARLLLELRRLPDGPAKFRRLVFLASKGRWDSGEFFEIYRSDFPSPQEAEKWWTARLARPPDLPRLAGMGLLETCRRLSAILEDGYPEPGLTGLRASDMKSVNESENQLYQLMLRGHPMTRPAIEAAINALEALKINDTRRARPAWENAGTILQALVPWKQQIDAELDRQEYLRAPPTPGQWLDQKGVGGD